MGCNTGAMNPGLGLKLGSNLDGLYVGNSIIYLDLGAEVFGVQGFWCRLRKFQNYILFFKYSFTFTSGKLCVVSKVG